MKFLPVAVATALFFSLPAFAGAMDDGQMAFDHGDYQAALEQWKPLAEQGNVEAQDKVGYMYESGYGVDTDEKEAMKWYRKAADQGDAEALVNIGEMYRNGKGVTKDPAEAATWYRKAADKGDPAAEMALGQMYEDGEGVKRDYAEALFWMSLTQKSGMDDGEVAGKARETYAAHLTPEQMKAVDQRVKNWQPATASKDTEKK